MPPWLPPLLRRIRALAGTTVYVKVTLRAECVVVSFHEDEGQSDEEGS
jgi:hypothetical protein